MAGQRIAQEQAVEAVGEAVAFLPGHAEAGAVPGVERPVDAGAGEPVADLVEVFRIDAEAARDRRLLQQAEDLADDEARAGEREQFSSNARAGALTCARARPVIVYGRWRRAGAVPNTASISGAAASRSGVTTSTSPGLGGFGPAKIASSRSCSTSSSRVIEWQTCTSMLRSSADSRTLPGARSVSSSTAFLQRAQQRGRIAGDEAGVADERGVGRVDQQAQLRLRLLPPGGQQAVAFLVERLLAAQREPREPREPAVLDDVEPELAARVEHVQMQVDVLAQALQQLQVHGRQRGWTEHVGRDGQRAGAGEAEAALVHRLQQVEERVSAVRARLARDRRRHNDACHCWSEATPGSALPRSTTPPLVHASSQSGR